MSANPTDSVPKTSSNHLNRQIAQYSVAAAVAGVSMLALAQPAAGEVVFTKKTIHLPLATGGTMEPVKISMANNGIDNFEFTLSSTPAFGAYRFLLAGGASLQDELRVGTGPAFNVYLGALRRGAADWPEQCFVAIQRGPCRGEREQRRQQPNLFWQLGRQSQEPLSRRSISDQRPTPLRLDTAYRNDQSCPAHSGDVGHDHRLRLRNGPQQGDCSRDRSNYGIGGEQADGRSSGSQEHSKSTWTSARHARAWCGCLADVAARRSYKFELSTERTILPRGQESISNF